MKTDKQMKPENILQEADRLVNGERRKTYDHPLDNHERIAAGWGVIFGHDVTAEQASLAMAWVKICREVHAHKRDNLVDLAGYAAVTQEIHEERARRLDVQKASCPACLTGDPIAANHIEADLTPEEAMAAPKIASNHIEAAPPENDLCNDYQNKTATSWGLSSILKAYGKTEADLTPELRMPPEGSKVVFMERGPFLAEFYFTNIHENYDV